MFNLGLYNSCGFVVYSVITRYINFYSEIESFNRVSATVSTRLHCVKELFGVNESDSVVDENRGFNAENCTKNVEIQIIM